MPRYGLNEIMQLYAPKVATAIVIANMIGTGVFTTLGFQLLELQSPVLILVLWAVGGLSAVCGAMCYAELGARYPGSGGEVHFLGTLVHPYAGFLSGCVSATIGFAAPTALAALTFGTYLSAVSEHVNPAWAATVLIVSLVLIHAKTHSRSGSGQYLLTTLKLCLIVFFIVWALLKGPYFTDQLSFTAPIAWRDAFGASSAVALIFINYAYSGWNAATYILSEMENPAKNLPKVLLFGCGLVAVLYVLLNAVFIVSAPISELRGKVEIGFVVANSIAGEAGGTVIAIVLAGILISTVSAMVLAGPRALQRLGEDNRLFAPLAKRNRDGIPTRAILFMAAIALVFLWTSTFREILLFSGLMMAANTFVTVVALFISRRNPQPTLNKTFQVPFFPLPALIFLGITGWTVVYSVQEYPTQLLLLVLVSIIGFPLYKRHHLTPSD